MLFDGPGGSNELLVDVHVLLGDPCLERAAARSVRSRVARASGGGVRCARDPFSLMGAHRKWPLRFVVGVAVYPYRGKTRQTLSLECGHAVVRAGTHPKKVRLGPKYGATRVRCEQCDKSERAPWFGVGRWSA